MSDNRYWVSPTYSQFDSTSNWSLSSGGSGGAPVPASSQVAIFDQYGQGSCQVNVPVEISGIRVLADYSGTVQLEQYPFSIGVEDGTFNGGYFIGGSSLIDVTGNLTITDTNFVSTTTFLNLYGGLNYTLSTVPVSPYGKNLFIEYRTLGPYDIASKRIVLSVPPEDASSVIVNIVRGVAQELGTDYNVSGQLLTWDQSGGTTGLSMSQVVTAGDVLRIAYNPADGYKTFFHSYATVRFAGNGNVEGRGVRFWNLSVDSTGSGQRIDSSCFVDNSLIFSQGALRQGSDGTVHVWGDVTAASGGGIWSSDHRAIVQMEGPREQKIIASGGILPTVVIDKTSGERVICGGNPPLYVNGDLLVVNGTLSTAGINLEIGNP